AQHYTPSLHDALPISAENHIKWAATLTHVREVSLLGSADLVFWTQRLKEEELLPREENGKAQIMILGAQAKFMGLFFREISISRSEERRVGKVGRVGA